MVACPGSDDASAAYCYGFSVAGELTTTAVIVVCYCCVVPDVVDPSTDRSKLCVFPRKCETGFDGLCGRAEVKVDDEVVSDWRQVCVGFCLCRNFVVRVLQCT